MNPENWFDVYIIYREYLFATLPQSTAQARWNKFRTALFRYVLFELEFKREDYFRKLTKAEVTRGEEYLKTLWLRSLLRIRALVIQGLEKLNASPASFNTFKSAIELFAVWGEQEVWWPNNRGANGMAVDQLCPPRNPRGAGKRPPRLSEKGAFTVYGLKLHELPLALQEDVRRMGQFLVANHFPGRVIDPVEASTSENHTKTTLLYLGWFHRYRCPQVALEDLSLDLIFPAFSDVYLESMTAQERKRFWRVQKEYQQQWLHEYREFLRAYQWSDNPRTWLGKLETVLAVGHYQWERYVEQKADYQQIPLFPWIRSELNRTQKEVGRWACDGRYTADQTLKWPEFVPQEDTALGVIRRDVWKGCGQNADRGPGCAVECGLRGPWQLLSSGFSCGP
jgi:hypothetical protein